MKGKGFKNVDSVMIIPLRPPSNDNLDDSVCTAASYPSTHQLNHNILFTFSFKQTLTITIKADKTEIHSPPQKVPAAFRK